MAVEPVGQYHRRTKMKKKKIDKNRSFFVSSSTPVSHPEFDLSVASRVHVAPSEECAV